MILVILRMKVPSKKRSELSQAIVSLTGSIRAKKGCRSCAFCRNLQNENELCLIEEWDTPEDLNSHLKSEHFKVLRGAMNLLKEPYEMTIHTVFHTEEDGKDVMTEYTGEGSIIALENRSGMRETKNSKTTGAA